MIRQTCLVSGAVALLTACAITQPPVVDTDTARPIAFIVMDADESGALDRGEWEAYGNAMFDKLDLNGNGQLRDREIDRSFEAFDLDGSGVLTHEELFFPFLDRDQSTDITREEFNGHFIIHGLDPDRDHRVTREEMRVRRHDAFTVFDRNASGLVTLDELDVEGSPFSPFRL